MFLGFYENDEYQHECTGSVITENAIITAAHCTTQHKGYNFSYRFAASKYLLTVNIVVQ